MQIKKIVLLFGLVGAVAALPQTSGDDIGSDPGTTPPGDGTGASPSDIGTGGDATATAGDNGSSPTEASGRDPTAIFYSELTVAIQSIVTAIGTASAAFDSALEAFPTFSADSDFSSIVKAAPSDFILDIPCVTLSNQPAWATALPSGAKADLSSWGTAIESWYDDFSQGVPGLSLEPYTVIAPTKLCHSLGVAAVAPTGPKSTNSGSAPATTPQKTSSATVKATTTSPRQSSSGSSSSSASSSSSTPSGAAAKPTGAAAAGILGAAGVMGLLIGL